MNAEDPELLIPEVLGLLQEVLEVSGQQLLASEAALRHRDEGIVWLRSVVARRDTTIAGLRRRLNTDLPLQHSSPPDQPDVPPPAATARMDYAEKLAIESRKWGGHLQLEASGVWHSWLCQPIVLANYQHRNRIENLAWPEWARKVLGGPARRSLDLGCGSGGTSLKMHAMGATLRVEGFDISEARIAEAERRRIAAGIDGRFCVSDVNHKALPASTYDLIVSKESFHHFIAVENIMEQVHQALTPDGLFILEEFVGPTQFQWTNLQMLLAQAQLARLPERLRILAWGALKNEEGRPTPAIVEAESPFESIRSAEIVSLFQKYFDVVAIRKLGGTIQQLLYNGIAHNFRLDDEEAVQQVKSLCALENLLVDRDIIPSDFMLLIGRRRKENAR